MSAPAPYWIPSHVRACSAGEATVILDLKRNRYFGVGARETRALRVLAANWSEACTQAAGVIEPMASAEAMRLADALEAAGLLTRVESNDVSFSPLAVNLDTLLRDIGAERRRPPIRLMHVMRFLHACLWARRALRSRSLFALTSDAARERTSARNAFDETRATELARIFQRLRPFAFAAHERCLFHALALVRFLSYYEVFPLWVIGVRIRPWAAHSWVQHGSLILDGNPEQVCQYTPILAA